MTNKEKLQFYVAEQKRPIIVYNVETTGCMDGNDNRITQIALAAYEYNMDNRKYELQDHMFMLAKPNEKSLQNIENRQKITNENITILLQEDYVESYTHELKKDLTNCKKRIETLDRKIAKSIEKYGNNSEQVEKYLEQLEKERALENQLTRELREKEDYVKNHRKELLATAECAEFVKANFDTKKEQLENNVSLKDVLSSQGILLSSWREGNVGLSFGEIQIGINKFLKKYQKIDTVFMSNGTYFAKHYMDKEKLKLNQGKDEIDIPKVLGQKDWTYSLSTICTDYFNQTGKTIQHFDALTKVLCMVEMVGSSTGIVFQNTSKKYLEEQVKWDAAKGRDKDYEEGDYVITMSQLEKSHIVMDIPRYDKNIPTFNSLEYIDFGSERRYVDIDKMFEVNDNFEITLEGEKDPIKTWKELEEKIKALNGEVSVELLNRIHEKYEELQEKVAEEKEEFEQLKDGISESHLEKHPEQEQQKPVEIILSRIFEKNNELNKVIEKQQSLLKEKWDAIVQDMKALDNVLQSIGLNNVRMDDKTNFHYQVGRQCITDGYSKESDDVALKLSSNLINLSDTRKCVEDFIKNWDNTYEKILLDIESKLDANIEESKNSDFYYDEMDMEL